MSVYDKILAVKEEIGFIGKDGEAAFGQTRFKFQAWDDVLPAVSAACSKCGLVILESMTGSSRSLVVYNDAYGKEKQVPKTIVQLKFVLVADGEREECTWEGEALDTDDKAIQKAATSGTKYWYLKTFQISCVGDDDPDSSSPKKGKKSTQGQQLEDERNNQVDRTERIKLYSRLLGWYDTGITPQQRTLNLNKIKERAKVEGSDYIDMMEVDCKELGLL